MDTLRILFISIYDPSQGVSGPANHLRHLSKALVNLGCEIHILTYGPLTTDMEKEGVHYHYYNPGVPNRLSAGFLFSILSVKVTHQLIRKYKINIVHGQSPSSFGYSLFASKTVPFIVTLHGTSFGEISSITSIPIKNLTFNAIRDALFIQPITAVLTSIEYMFADKIIAVSKSIAKETELYYHIPAEDIAVFYNGSHPLNVPATSQDNCYTILYVGRLVWRKGVCYLIDSLPEIRKKFPNIRLFIIGIGDQDNSLRKYVDSKGLSSIIKFLGRISQVDLENFYATSTVCVQPSLYEPCPLTVLEEMAYGKPIVATRVGGIPELITSGTDGLLVEPGNSIQLAKAILNILSDPQLAAKLGANAKMRIDLSYNWATIAKKVVAYYDRLLNT